VLDQPGPGEDVVLLLQVLMLHQLDDRVDHIGEAVAGRVVPVVQTGKRRRQHPMASHP
jgi:hypothetical protein